jgi:hypothetical protein
MRLRTTAVAAALFVAANLSLTTSAGAAPWDWSESSFGWDPRYYPVYRYGYVAPCCSYASYAYPRAARPRAFTRRWYWRPW